ncbi:zeta toxin family protein [Spirosoma migulaei]
MLDELGVTPSELQLALHRSREEVFAEAVVQQYPIGVILGGQPAAGKSLLIGRIQDDQPELPFVVINGDEFRAFHPRFNEFNRAGELEAANATQPFANYIGQTLLTEAIENRYNIIIEGTMRNPDVPAATAHRFRQHGYSPEAHILAVPFEQSLQGIYIRYERQKEIGSSGRFTPLAIHQEAYEGALKSVDKLYREQRVDRLVIYSRGAKIVLIDYKIEDGQWSSQVEPSREIERERNRLWTPKEIADYAVTWERILHARKKRGAEPDPLPNQRYQQVLNEIKTRSTYGKAYRKLKEESRRGGYPLE